MPSEQGTINRQKDKKSEIIDLMSVSVRAMRAEEQQREREDREEKIKSELLASCGLN